MPTRHSHALPFGATLRSDGRTLFRLWAPSCSEVTLSVEGLAPLAMSAEGEGWHVAEAPCSAGARYRFEVDHKPLALRANVENLFNESSWQSAYTGGIVYRGTPRTIYVSLTADF